jgi:SsrA-binding protein
MRLIASNKKAYFDYQIFDTIEAGIVLTGDEVKSVRNGHVNLTGSFATIHDAEVTLINAHIAPYSHAFQKNDDASRRTRKLLLHRREINKIIGEISRKGIILVPLKIYFNKKNLVKVELGLAKHKKSHEKKETLKERDIERETRRELRGKYRY